MMKNYNAWMNSSDNSEEIMYDMCEKSLIKINNSSTEYEIIVNDANEWQKEVDVIWLVKKSIFQPNVGDFIEFQGNKYLSVFVPEERETYWSSKARLCNSTYPIKLTKTTVLVGHNTLGKPMYKDSYEIDRQEPCIVESRNYATDTNAQLIIPNNSVLITIKYQPSDTLVVNYEFTMYNNKYKIVDIDYTKIINEKGIIKILAERV
jgi:hypothetical protein